MKSNTIDFGIDLGTTNSTIASICDIEPVVYKNNEGSESTPSALWMDKKGRIHVGRTAKERIEEDGENGFMEFKREMGADTKFMFQRTGASYTPEELSSFVLKSLRDNVRRRLNREINSVVITVPADFTLPACNATNKAAEMAGFISHPLLQEPIAAAMAYGFQSESDNKFWMVYDFGGGTFDAAVIKIKDGQLEVVHHGGDAQLGGKDIDREIVNKLLVPAVQEEFDLTDFNPNNPVYKRAFAKLKGEAEKAKIRLSMEDSLEIFIDNLYKNEDGEAMEFSYELTKEKFRTLVNPFIVRSINISKKVLIEKKLAPSNIEKIIMVGGTSLIPYLQELLLDTNVGLGRPLEASIDPLTVVAKGAAIFAATQIAPVNEREELKHGTVLLELDYQPVGSETEPTIGGKIVTDDATNYGGYMIEFVNKSVVPNWRSGKINLSPIGGFVTQLWANKGIKNIFNIELYDSTGCRYNTIPESISYTLGIVSVGAPLIHSIGVAMANNETDFLLKKGTLLPAKEKRIHKNVAEVRVGQVDDVIKIPVVQGENERRADHNREVGALVIPASEIKRNLPAGSEIEIELLVDTSSLVTVRAFIPILDEEFEVKVNLLIESKKTDDLAKDFSRAKEKYENFRIKAEKESDTKAVQVLSPISDENMIIEIKELLISAEADSDARIKAQCKILDLNTILDYAEEALEWPTLVAEANEVLEKAANLTGEYGTHDDERKFEALKNEVKIAILEKDPDLLRKRISQMDGYYWILLKEQPGIWVGWLNYVKDNKSELKDMAKGVDIIAIADRAIIDNNFDGLKVAVNNLYELLPVADQEKIGLGGTTYRI